MITSQQIRKSSRLLLLSSLIFLSSHLLGQSSYILNKSYNNLSWQTFVEKVESNYQVSFFYDQSIIPEITISFNVDTIELIKLLELTFNSGQIKVSIDKSGNIFLSKNIALKTQLPSDYFEALNKKVEDLKTDTLQVVNDTFLKTLEEYISKKIVVGSKQKGLNQKIAKVSGQARSANNGSPIVGATIMEEKLKHGVSTDNNGHFELDLEIGVHKLIINAVNIKEQIIEVEVLSDGKLDLILEDKVVQLEDVVITAKQDDKVKTTEMGIERLNIENVKKIPLVFGERDVIKVALLLPGVQTVGEGTSGFNIRGSSSDQNLFYINKVPVYNTSHVAGFFSAFNSDAIDKFSLYKSSIPVNYGGRLASVFDITSKRGSVNKFKANGGIGIITQRLMVEGPIKKEKSSFVVGLRSTYSDWVLKLLDNAELKNSKVKFGDLLLNLNFQLNERNQLNIFSYLSTDNIQLADRTKYDYQNIGASIDWKHYFENKYSFELSLAHSNYNFNEDNTEIESIAYKDGNQLNIQKLPQISIIRLEKTTCYFSA